jgi:hypothetical protein
MDDKGKTGGNAHYTELERLQKKANALVNERNKSWLPVYKDLRAFISPYSAQFEGDITNSGERRDQKINNPKPIRASERLSAGMSSGMSSKSRPWFEVVRPKDAKDTMPVRRWLYAVQSALRITLSKTNLYESLEQVYNSQGIYGTAAMSCVAHRGEVIRFTHYPCGSYCLDTNDQGDVDTFYRCEQMTPRQMVQKFGADNVSAQARLAAERGDISRITVHHLIEPNPDADMRYVDNLSMPYKSTYWESNSGGENCGILRRSGFKHFPIAAPRWLVTGNNVYGTGPGYQALPKSRELQKLESDKMRLISHLANPNRTAPVSLKGLGGGSIVPGGINWVPDNLIGIAMQPTYVPDPNAIGNLRAEINECETDIGEAFSEDLFLLITNRDATMTAYEVAQLQEEKIAMLGPVIERNEKELLDPVITLTFDAMVEQSMPRWMGLLPGEPLLPPPPEELQDMALDVGYISVLAQAQKAVATSSIQRAAQFTGMLMGAGFQDAGDKFNPDAAQDEFYDAIGAPPTILRGDDEVAAIRQNRAQMQQQQMAMEQGKALVDGVKTLSETPTGGDTALSALAGGGLNG